MYFIFVFLDEDLIITWYPHVSSFFWNISNVICDVILVFHRETLGFTPTFQTRIPKTIDGLYANPYIYTQPLCIRENQNQKHNHRLRSSTKWIIFRLIDKISQFCPSRMIIAYHVWMRTPFFVENTWQYQFITYMWVGPYGSHISTHLDKCCLFLAK